MKILIISPLGFAINENTRYGGIESLVFSYTKELSKNHSVAALAVSQSIFPANVEVLRYTVKEKEDIFVAAELSAYQKHQGRLREFDVIHDFSHQHLAARYNVNLPTLNNFWHAPLVARFPKAPYNIIAPSKWAEREFRRVYGQEAKYMGTLVIDTGVYCLSCHNRNNRFLTLGMMTPRKGNLEAAMLCREMNVPLDIVGRSDGGEYEQKIRELCNEDIRFLGEVSQEEKIRLLQTNKAMIFYNKEPEVMSHKVQEALLCGMPVIAPPIGALPEIIENGKTGYLCSTDSEFQAAIRNCQDLSSDNYEKLLTTYAVENVVSRWIPLYEEVAEGLRWK